jgi:hypothetical protein
MEDAAVGNAKIRFEGFSPSPFMRTYFKSLVESLNEETPAWSQVRATVRRVGKGLRGMIQVNSRAGVFFATAHSDRATDLGHKLMFRLRRQLDKWKGRRFAVARARRPRP